MSRRRTRRRLIPTRRVLFVAVFVGAALVGSSFVRVTLQEHALARETAGVAAEIAGLEVRRAELDAEIAARRTDAYVEEKARELGYVRPGEGLATLKDAKAASVVDVSASTPSRVRRWWSLFFH